MLCNDLNLLHTHLPKAPFVVLLFDFDASQHPVRPCTGVWGPVWDMTQRVAASEKHFHVPRCTTATSSTTGTAAPYNPAGKAFVHSVRNILHQIKWQHYTVETTSDADPVQSSALFNIFTIKLNCCIPQLKRQSHYFQSPTSLHCWFWLTAIIKGLPRQSQKNLDFLSLIIAVCLWRGWVESGETALVSSL